MFLASKCSFFKSTVVQQLITKFLIFYPFLSFSIIFTSGFQYQITPFYVHCQSVFKIFSFKPQ